MMNKWQDISTNDIKTDWDLRYEIDTGITVTGNTLLEPNNKQFWDSGIEIASIISQIAGDNINSVAEFGSGPGRVLSHFITKDKTGYDISEKAIEIGRKYNNNIKFKLIKDVSEMQEHDLIYTFLVLQHNTKLQAIKIAKTMISKSKKICIMDFPDHKEFTCPEDVELDTWTSRGYSEEELHEIFPNAEVAYYPKFKRFILTVRTKL